MNNLGPQELYDLAVKRAVLSLSEPNAPVDNNYGCGTSFVVIKWGTEFMRWARKQGLVKRDSYYGWILETKDSSYAKATLAQEHYNEAFAKFLSDHGVHAFNHTYLT